MINKKISILRRIANLSLKVAYTTDTIKRLVATRKLREYLEKYVDNPHSKHATLNNTDVLVFDYEMPKLSKCGYEFEIEVNGVLYGGSLSIYASEDECYLDGLECYTEKAGKLMKVDDEELVDFIIDKLTPLIDDRHSEYLEDRRQAAADAVYERMRDGD
jgi:hypothetical protein